jgi:CxxC motif-containing protein
MEELKKLICISCPQGCTLEVTVEGKTVLKVNGESCKHGIEYAEQEITDPRRMIASTVRVKNGFHPLVSVYTKMPIPKDMINNVLKELREVELTAPVTLGTIVIKNVFGTGIDVITSRDMPTRTAEQDHFSN